jgi:predicted DNA-binding antitoxin AbrB/MazE fold protein
MVGQSIEAVFENGVFRPLQPVTLPEKQRVTLVLPPAPVEVDEVDEEVSHQPLPLKQRKTIRVRLKRGPDFGPLPYPVDTDDMELE